MLHAILLASVVGFFVARNDQSEPQAEAPKEESPSPVAAAAETKEALQAQVRKLVKQLDAAEKAARDAAEQELLAMGAAIIEHLPEITDRTPAELKLRLERVRSELESSRAEQAVRATVVTLQVDGILLTDAIKAIEEQTGNRLVDYREEFNQEKTNPKLKLDLKDVPFWQACDAVLDQAKLSLYASPDSEIVGDGLAFVAQADGQRPRLGAGVYAGAFRLECYELTARRDLRAPDTNMLQVMLEAAWEPRLRPIVLMQPADAARATDDQSTAISLAAEATELEIPMTPGTKSVDLPMQFQLPQADAKRIASLQGRLLALMPGRVETFRFEKLAGAKNVRQRKAGVSVVLEQTGKNEELFEVRVLVVFDEASGALESHRNWVFDNPAWLEMPDKKRIAPVAWDTTRQDEREAGVAYMFPVDDLKGAAFVYETPAAIVNVPVEYELKDLELP